LAVSKIREPRKEKLVWYFAYGSNMNKDDLEQWCKEKGYSPIELVSPVKATLLDHKLCFTHYSPKRKGGVADIIPCENEKVEGILCQVTQDDLDKIEEKEGVPNVYRRKIVNVVLGKRTTQCAITYEVRKKEGAFLPSWQYMNTIIKGANAHHLSRNYVSKLEKIKVKDDPEKSKKYYIGGHQ